MNYFATPIVIGDSNGTRLARDNEDPFFNASRRISIPGLRQKQLSDIIAYLPLPKKPSPAIIAMTIDATNLAKKRYLSDETIDEFAEQYVKDLAIWSKYFLHTTLIPFLPQELKFYENTKKIYERVRNFANERGNERIFILEWDRIWNLDNQTRSQMLEFKNQHSRKMDTIHVLPGMRQDIRQNIADEYIRIKQNNQLNTKITRIYNQIRLKKRRVDLNDFYKNKLKPEERKLYNECKEAGSYFHPHGKYKDLAEFDR